MPHNLDPRAALARLKEGNDRFVRNIRSPESMLSQASRRDLAQTPQRPVAIILSCSDSRAPSELVFDQGLGDLFVIRVAGNIIAPSLVGSVEFAAASFGTRLVVVMGHSGCGAIAATLDALRTGEESLSENIHDILSRIRPHVEHLVEEEEESEDELPHAQQMERAVRANVRASVHELRHGSRILEKLASNGELEIVGAEYCLETGKVEFLDA